MDSLDEEIKTLEKKIEDSDVLVKTLEEEKADLTKKLEKADVIIKDVNDAAAKKEHDDLVVKALGLVKELNPKTEVKDEDALLKSISENFDEGEVEENPDACIKQEIKAMEIAKTHIPNGDLPGTHDADMDDQLTEDEKEAAELRKMASEQGIIKVGDD